jgi:hypothetical protein
MSTKALLLSSEGGVLECAKCLRYTGFASFLSDFEGPMTFARTVRLVATFVIVTGISASGLSLFAQSQGQIRQYDPNFDEAPASSDRDDWGDVPAYVSAVSGEARLHRANDDTGDFEQVPLQIGDQIRTTRGRVEILYSDGSIIALDEYSSVTVDGESTWRIHTGRIKAVSRDDGFIIDAAPVGIARLRENGDYRVTLAVNRRSEPELEVSATRGSAELENPLGRTLVRAGTRALTTERYAPSVPYAFAAPRDEFERWTESLESDRYGVTSTRYLPVELRAYGGDFDRHGYWAHHHTHGYVWYPRVAVGWQPFHSGRWSFVVGFGYNWIGGSRWEWPTHHYGRWDRWGSNWFWVPSRPAGHWRHVGYSAPRRSFNVSVSYYSRPVSSRPLPSYRGNTSSRSRVIDIPRGDNRRPSNSAWTSPSPAQPRVAIPRGTTVTREPSQVTRPSTYPSTRPAGSLADPRSSAPSERPSIGSSRSDEGGVRSRQAIPRENPQMNRPAVRETPQFGRPDNSVRERRPAPAPETAPRPAPSTESPRPSRSGPAAGVGRMPEPQGSRAAPPPAGSRTPSSSSRTPSGSAVRRGGGGG